MLKSSCLILGSATVDTIAYLTQEPETIADTFESYIRLKKGAKLEVQTLIQSIGGGALNSALCLSMLGHTSKIYCAIGNDDAGKKIKSFTQEKNLIFHPIIVALPTGSSFVVPLHNDRIIFSHHGANTQLPKQQFNETYYHGTTALYVAPLHGESLSNAHSLIQKARTFYEENTIAIAINPSIEQIQQTTHFKALLPFIDVIIMNADELRICASTLNSRFFTSTGEGIIKDGPPLARTLLSSQKITFTLREICKELFSYGIKRIVITDGAQGAYVITKDTLYFHQSLPITVGTALGAGDAFGATFFSLILHGFTIENALRGASINAASLIHHITPHQGLLSLKEIEKKIKIIDPTFLKTYPFCSR